MFNNVFCVEKEEGRSTVGVFMTLGGSVLVYGCSVLRLLKAVWRNQQSLGTHTVHTVQYRELNCNLKKKRVSAQMEAFAAGSSAKIKRPLSFLRVTVEQKVVAAYNVQVCRHVVNFFVNGWK